MRPSVRIRLLAALVVVAALPACSAASRGEVATPGAQGASIRRAAASPGPGSPPASSRPLAPAFRDPIPGMPTTSSGDVYAATRTDGLRRDVARDPAYLYVPNSFGEPVTTVIDQRTRKIVRVLRTGTLSQHVTPSYDLRSLYVEASYADALVQIDPRTARIRRTIRVDRPYNLYATPDGRRAIVINEDKNEVVFTDPRSFRRRAVVSDPTCRGPNHADFSANGRYFLVTCEFSGTLLKISTLGRQVVGRLDLGPGSKPQDVRLAPDGRSFYVVDLARDRLLRVDGQRFRVLDSTRTPAGPHGIYPSRDGRFLYVSNRGAGKVTVFSLRQRRIVDTWTIPGGGTPDMGGVSADGRTLWLTGRTSGYVYGWDTRSGRLVAKIAVGGNPHGMLVWPQPGRYSLGHTGTMR